MTLPSLDVATGRPTPAPAFPTVRRQLADRAAVQGRAWHMPTAVRLACVGGAFAVGSALVSLAMG